jgi:NAD(P)-dependent dehydrogenase (short-subunit alcohol dehydrogenase family)
MQDMHAIGDDAALAGKVIMIAGSGQDVSEATARLFARSGAEGLLICGRQVERGQAVAAIISAAGCPTEFLPTDFAKLEDCAALIAEADKVFGRIDVLIFAAGTVAPRAGAEQLAEHFDQIVAINQRAPFFLMLGAAKLMQRDERPGTMVTVLGMPGEGEPLPIAAYEASQGALAAMTRSFATGLIDYQIRVLGLDLGGCVALADTANGTGSAPAHPAFAPLEIAGALALLVADPTHPPAGSIVPIDQLLPAGAPPAELRPTPAA